MNLGHSIANVTARLIKKEGQVVTISRRAATQGGTATAWTLSCLPQPVETDDASRLSVFGNLNWAEATPHEFIFAGNVVLAEATDTLSYNGFKWRILTVIPQPGPGGVVAATHALGVRAPQ